MARALVPLVVWALFVRVWLVSSHEFLSDGTILELDDSNFNSAIASFDYLLVDFYAPWCGHCKRLSPELEAAAPQLAALNQPIIIAKIDADKYRKVGSKYEIDGFPTLMIFMHGVPIEYHGPRKSDLLVRYVKKFVAPDVSLLESDSAISSFIENAGTSFPIFIGFGLETSLVVEYATKYKKKAWFAVAKDFSEDIMVKYDFDKVPALIALHPNYNEQSIFYGPFEGEFLEEFIHQNQLPLTVPINFETLKLLTDDKRKIVLTILEDLSNEKSLALVKTLRAAATANRDLVFGYVGYKQWEEFVDTFNVNKKSQLPKMLVWDGNEEYHEVVGSENLNEEENIGSQITRFLEGYREGRTVKKRITGPSFMGFINSLINIKTVYLIVFVVAILMVVQMFSIKGTGIPQTKQAQPESEDRQSVVTSENEGNRHGYQTGDKED